MELRRVHVPLPAVGQEPWGWRAIYLPPPQPRLPSPHAGETPAPLPSTPGPALPRRPRCSRGREILEERGRAPGHRPAPPKGHQQEGTLARAPTPRSRGARAGGTRGASGCVVPGGAEGWCKCPVQMPRANAPFKLPCANAPCKCPVRMVGAKCPVQMPHANAPFKLPRSNCPMQMPRVHGRCKMPRANCPMQLACANAPCNCPMRMVSVKCPMQMPHAIAPCQ